MQTITPFLWFDGRVADAARFYCSVFKKPKIGYLNGRGKNIQSATLSLNGQKLILFNGGPHYKLTPSFSLMVQCKTQKEIDYYWRKLTQGGEESRCGWLVDRYGLSWQIIPDMLGAVLGDKDPAKAGRVMQAMFGMQKIIIKDLQRAHSGK